MLAEAGLALGALNFLKKPPPQQPTILGGGQSGVQVAPQQQGKSLTDMLDLGVAFADYNKKAGEREDQNRANGGPIQPGQMYTVGEQGPEQFMSTAPGLIASNPNTMTGNNSYNRLTSLLGNPGNSMRPMFTDPNMRGIG
jgi:hypothetical protein